MHHHFRPIATCIVIALCSFLAMSCSSGPSYADGSYQASGAGIHGPVNVTMEISNGVIASITVTGHNETPGIGSLAVDALPTQIVEAQGTEEVDDISGATVTSQAIKNAVNAALEQAAGK